MSGWRDTAASSETEHLTTVKERGLAIGPANGLRVTCMLLPLRTIVRNGVTLALAGLPRQVNGGGRGPVSAEWMVPKALWLATHEPAVWAAAATVCEYQDYINLRLTGRLCASVNNMSVRWHYSTTRGGPRGRGGGAWGAHGGPRAGGRSSMLRWASLVDQARWKTESLGSMARLSANVHVQGPHGAYCFCCIVPCLYFCQQIPRIRTTCSRPWPQACRTACWPSWASPSWPPSGPRRCCGWASWWAASRPPPRSTWAWRPARRWRRAAPTPSWACWGWAWWRRGRWRCSQVEEGAVGRGPGWLGWRWTDEVLPSGSR